MFPSQRRVAIQRQIMKVVTQRLRDVMNIATTCDAAAAAANILEKHVFKRKLTTLRT